MRKGGGKSKGSSFERLICKQLSLWISNGSCEDAYWRSAMSGGRSTVASAKGKRLAAQAGDISCVNPVGHPLTSKFIIELKFYSSLDFDSLIFGTGKLIAFWTKLCEEAAFYKKIPLLIAKQNHQPILVCTNTLGLHLLAPSELCKVHLFKQDMKVFLLQDLLSITTSRILNYDFRLGLRDFRSHRSGAARRGIEFEFELDSWVDWWEKQLGGDWQNKRGSRKGQFCMARNEDFGPYASWNVQCKRQEENASERAINGTAARGTKVNTNKLSMEQVLDIFYDPRSLDVLAEEYGIDRTHVWLIKRKKTWKWLLDDTPGKRLIKKREKIQ